MARSFSDVQAFFTFLDDLTDATKRKTINGDPVDLLSNLDPSGNTNTALELAKIYSWYQKMVTYDPNTQSFTINNTVLPSDVKNVADGIYDPTTNKFYTDSTKTTEIPAEGDRIYVDVSTNTIYRYDDTDKRYEVLVGENTTYAFKEGTTDGTFQYSVDGGSWTSVKIHNVATLGSDGKVPESQLPSYVDDVIEGYYDATAKKFYSDSAKTHEITPETGKIYVDLTTNKTYRWSGSTYVEISSSLALGETSSTAYRGDRGKIAYDHSQKTGTGTVSDTNPHGLSKTDIGLGNVDNTADADKEVKSADTLKTARTIDGVEFNGSANIIHYGECSTAAATAAKTVSITGFKLATGAWVAVKFTVTNSAAVASLTLNVTSTGAKPIKYRNANLSSAGILAANRTYMFVYDGTNYQLVGDLDTDADTKVRQSLTSANENHPLLIAYSTNTVTTANVDNVSYRVNTIYVNPSTGSLYTTNLYAGTEITAPKITVDNELTVGGKPVLTEDDILILHCNNKPSVMS